MSTIYAPPTPPQAPQGPPPRQPWYRQTWAWAAGLALVITAGTGITVALLAGSGHSPAGTDPVTILHQDGYTMTMTVTGSQLGQLAGTSELGQYVTSAAVGVDPGTGVDEAVVQFSTAGEQRLGDYGSLSAIQAGLPAGVSVRMVSGDLVISGPASAFSGS